MNVFACSLRWIDNYIDELEQMTPRSDAGESSKSDTSLDTKDPSGHVEEPVAGTTNPEPYQIFQSTSRMAQDGGAETVVPEPEVPPSEVPQPTNTAANADASCRSV